MEEEGWDLTNGFLFPVESPSHCKLQLRGFLSYIFDVFLLLHASLGNHGSLSLFTEEKEEEETKAVFWRAYITMLIPLLLYSFFWWDFIVGLPLLLDVVGGS